MDPTWRAHPSWTPSKVRPPPPSRPTLLTLPALLYNVTLSTSPTASSSAPLPALLTLLPAPLPALLIHALTIFHTHIYPSLHALSTLLLGALAPLLATLSSSTSSSTSFGPTDLLPLAATLLALYVGLRAIDYVRRTVVALIVLAIRIAFWMALAGVGLWVWRRGPAQAAKDAGQVAGAAAGVWRALSGEGAREGRRRAGAWEAAAGPGRRRGR